MTDGLIPRKPSCFQPLRAMAGNRKAELYEKLGHVEEPASEHIRTRDKTTPDTNLRTDLLVRLKALPWSRLVDVCVTAALLMGAAAMVPVPVSAEPSGLQVNSVSSGNSVPPRATTASSDVAAIDHVEPISDRWLRVFVRSPAMGRVVQVQVLLPVRQRRERHRGMEQSKPRPTVYMLDGDGAPADGNDWIDRGGAVQFFADKDVNVVLTIGGAAGYYTDWQRRDLVLGNNKWETFLTGELPPLINARFHGNGRNGIEGLSMGAQAAMMLATRNPRLYSAVAAYSGCYAMGTALGQVQARAVVLGSGGDPNNMFGTHDDPDWAAHDALVHAEALRGTAIYLSAGSGVPGEYDSRGMTRATVFGGPLEAGANLCTHQFADRLAQLHIPATVSFRSTGTHSWPYWADELSHSWPMMATALGVSS